MKRWKIALSALSFAAAPLALSGMAQAHGNMKAQHGGIVEMASETVVELVNGPKGVSIYVSNEDEPVTTAELTGKLTVTQGTRKSEVVLKPVARDRFDAPGLKLSSGAKVGVLLIEKASQARSSAIFTVK